MNQFERDRRDALKSIAAMFGVGLVAPLAHAIAAGAQPGMEPQNRFFTDAQRRAVSAISERIIPTTDTPGAIAAKVPDYIEMMLGDWYEDGERATFLEGLAGLESHCQESFGGAFADLSAEHQDAALTAAMNGVLGDSGEAFFSEAKQLTTTGYYTSEVGMTRERLYLPVPGRYDGDFPYTDVGTLFTG